MFERCSGDEFLDRWPGLLFGRLDEFAYDRFEGIPCGCRAVAQELRFVR
jgi:hypothetical protein